ncbi:MAG: hypothetical protein Q4F56_00805 [Candidatus Saccharibacteria bacterium]|nr:hypothetical protein [Candidatus Saccharibacteria bacterium]
MKSELATAIGTAIAGTVIAFILCGFLVGEIEPVSFNTVDNSVNAELADPNPEVFNYKALNPTVEVYVGNCDEVDASGQCVEQVTDEENP